MINKIIHYCWFGNKPLDSLALRCLESWKKYFPDYKIIQWNENNFDVTKVKFMSDAYKEKKWAFVSDVARLIVVYENGGIYFDTDVEVLRPYDDILKEGIDAFFGFENDEGFVATGLGFGAVQGHPFLKRHIEEYHKIDFMQYKERISDVACPIITTNLLLQAGLTNKNVKQHISGIDVFPSTYFNPIDYNTGKMKKTEFTHSIHWYNASWQDDCTKKEQAKLQKLRTVFGMNMAERIYGISTCIKREGIFPYVVKRIKKLRG